MKTQTLATLVGLGTLAFGVVAISPWSGSAFADFGLSAVLFDEDTGETGSNFDQTVGWAFNVHDAISVTSLQWFDDFGDGLTISHEVGIWNPRGTLLVSVVIPAGTAAQLEDGMWRSVKIPDLILPVADGYVIGGFNGLNALDRIAGGVDQTVIPEISWVESRFGFVNGEFELPENVTISNGIYGPSFQIPAPGVLALLGLAGLTGMRRRRC